MKIAKSPSLAEFSAVLSRYDTDKVTVHSYDRVYGELFSKRRFTTQRVLEIGVLRGESLRAWADWFENATIIGVDLVLPLIDHPRIDVWRGDVCNLETLSWLTDAYGSLDIIIDDGPHTEESQVIAWEALFPYLAPDGLYVIEDVQSIEVAHRIADARGGKIYDLQPLKGRFDDILIVWGKP